MTATSTYLFGIMSADDLVKAAGVRWNCKAYFAVRVVKTLGRHMSSGCSSAEMVKRMLSQNHINIIDQNTSRVILKQLKVPTVSSLAIYQYRVVVLAFKSNFFI